MSKKARELKALEVRRLSKATTETEIAICNDDELGALFASII